MNPDLLLSSEYTRALETARIIGMRTGTTPRVNGLFYEIVRPSKLFGKSHFSPVTFWYVIRSLFKKNNPKWRYEDAENFTDLSTRARRALGYLESLAGTHKSVVIVSHTIFVNIMVSYMCKDRLLSFSDLLLTFLHVERMRNGDVVHLEFIGKSPHTCAWRLVSHSKER
jgi:broad specificity phosphatase PhoE